MGRTSHTWYGPRQHATRRTPRNGGRARPAAPARTAPDPTTGQPHTWRIDLPGHDRPPLSLNNRTHWSTRHRLTTQLRDTVMWQAAALHIPRQDHPVSVQLVWEHRPDHRHRDGDNTIATVKPCTDGLVAAGVLAHDDDHRHVSTLPTLIQATGNRRIALLLHGTT